MMHQTEILAKLSRLCSVEEAVGGFRVTTHCMYPSNGLIRVTVRGGSEMAVVSDDGEALGEASSAGIEIKNPDRLLRHNIQARGLNIKDGVIYTPRIETAAIHIAVLHVANIAKETAIWLYEHGGVRRKQDFRQLLAMYLSDVFREQVAEAHIHGASNKPHRFANVISFANGHKFIVDAVANDPSSINARVVANLDVKSAGDPKIEQRIVYDDAEPWSATNLSLLKIGATPVPFSRAKEVITRVAEQARSAA